MNQFIELLFFYIFEKGLCFGHILKKHSLKKMPKNRLHKENTDYQLFEIKGFLNLKRVFFSVLMLFLTCTQTIFPF